MIVIILRIIAYISVPLIIGFVKKGSLNGKQCTTIALVWAVIVSTVDAFLTQVNIYAIGGAIIGGTISGTLVGDLAIFLASKSKNNPQQSGKQSLDTEKPIENSVENKDNSVLDKKETSDNIGVNSTKNERRYNISEVLKIGGYEKTDYQKVLYCLQNSDKYKNNITEYFSGNYIVGDINEILSELDSMMTEVQDGEMLEKEKQEEPSIDCVTDAPNENEEVFTIPEDTLRALKTLYDEGVLTEQEFAEKKRKLLKI